MATIKKKILTEYFDAIASGKKTCELRLADFNVAEGDMLKLREWDPEVQQYTGRELEKTVTHVNKFDVQKLFWSLDEIKKNGLYLLSLE